jgi:hypothetical protein
MRRYFKKSQTAEFIREQNEVIRELIGKLQIEKAKFKQAKQEARDARAQANGYASLLTRSGRDCNPGSVTSDASAS